MCTLFMTFPFVFLDFTRVDLIYSLLFSKLFVVQHISLWPCITSTYIKDKQHRLKQEK